MTRKCPQCGSLDVRRSAVRIHEVSLRHIFLSPYRCRACRKLFWTVGRRVYHLAIIVGIALVAGALGVSVIGILRHEAAAPEAMPTPTADAESILKLAKQSDPLAEHEVAKMYAAGRGVPKSELDRLVWLQRAAEHGNTDAQYDLGIALRDGRGMVQDYGRAMTWLQRAAQGGNGLAQLELGLMYRTGAGIATDNVKAYTWLNLAAAQGVAGADVARDTVLRQLSRAEIAEAQAEARRLSELQQKPAKPAP